MGASVPPTPTLTAVEAFAYFTIAALLDTVIGLRSFPGVLHGNLLNPDSYMRLDRLHDILARHAPLHVVLRDASGAGAILHWSHLLDSLLLLLALPLRPLLSQSAGLHIAAVLLGPLAMGLLARLRGLAAQECDFECCAREQAIELMGLVLARIAGMGCSEDLPYSPGRVSASRFVPSCFCGTPDGTRMARRTSIGTLSRIGVSTMAGWCSDRFCIWERSIRRRPPLGVKRSRYSTRRPESRER